MARKDIEVAAECTDIHPAVDDALTAVHQHDGPDGMGGGDHLVELRHGTQHVGCLRDGDQFRPTVEQFRQSFHHQPSRIVERQHTYLHATAAADQLPGDDVGVVFHLRHHDVVARPESEFAVAVRHGIHGGRRPRSKDYLLTRGGPDKRAYPFAGLLEQFGHLPGEVMHAAVHIGIHLLIQPAFAIDDTPRLLGGSRTVEVHQRPAVDRPRQYREILPYFFYIQHFALFINHGPIRPPVRYRPVSCPAASARCGALPLSGTASPHRTHCRFSFVSPQYVSFATDRHPPRQASVQTPCWSSAIFSSAIASTAAASGPSPNRETTSFTNPVNCRPRASASLSPRWRM